MLRVIAFNRDCKWTMCAILQPDGTTNPFEGRIIASGIGWTSYHRLSSVPEPIIEALFRRFGDFGPLMRSQPFVALLKNPLQAAAVAYGDSKFLPEKLQQTEALANIEIDL